MRKLTLVLAILFTPSSFSFEGSITYKELFGYGLLSQMRNQLIKGKCIDVGNYTAWTLGWIGAHRAGGDWKYRTKDVAEARAHCKTDTHNPMCDSLEAYIRLKTRAEKDEKREFEDYLMLQNAHSVSRNDLFSFEILDKMKKGDMERPKVGNCREANELVLSIKFHEVIMAKTMSGDDSLTEKLLNLYENTLDDESEDFNKIFADFQHDCDDDISHGKMMLLSEYESSIKNGCLDSLADSGLSIYDEKEVYCSGKTPLACSLFKQKAARRNVASEDSKE